MRPGHVGLVGGHGWASGALHWRGTGRSDNDVTFGALAHEVFLDNEVMAGCTARALQPVANGVHLVL